MGLFKLFHKKEKKRRDHSADSEHETTDENAQKKNDLKRKKVKAEASTSGSDKSSQPPLEEKKKKKGLKGMKKSSKKQKSKKPKRTNIPHKDERTPKEVFPHKSISSLARSLKGDDWQKLAYALGFLAQAVSHFTGRASSSQNTYSQAVMMLKTWRDQMPIEEILPRLSDALQRIRRHDLALKMGLELGVIDAKDLDEEEGGAPPRIRSILKSLSAADKSGPPYYESRLIISDDRISFLARQMLAREEWKRLAYAIGFIPDEVAHIIARASSSQNLYAQAHMMLMMWRLRTPPNEIVPRLKAGFVRIRRHDLVNLLKIGAIAGAGDMDEHLNQQLQNLREEINRSDNFGATIAERFHALRN